MAMCALCMLYTELYDVGMCQHRETPAFVWLQTNLGRVSSKHNPESYYQFISCMHFLDRSTFLLFEGVCGDGMHLF